MHVAAGIVHDRYQFLHKVVYLEEKDSELLYSALCCTNGTHNLLLFVIVSELEGVVEQDVGLPLVVVGVHDLKVLLREAAR